jgi:hypothetical protein
MRWIRDVLVSPAQIALIGRESNRLDEIAAGLHGDWRDILADYQSRTSRPSREMLLALLASVIARGWRVSVRTARAWRRCVRRA